MQSKLSTRGQIVIGSVETCVKVRFLEFLIQNEEKCAAYVEATRQSDGFSV